MLFTAPQEASVVTVAKSASWRDRTVSFLPGSRFLAGPGEPAQRGAVVRPPSRGW